MKAGFLQFCPLMGEINKNLEKVRNLLSSSKVPEILVIPELPFTGYTFKNREEAMELSEPVGEELTDKLIDICRDFNLMIATGFLERDGDNLYNSSLLLAENGVKGVYRKVHLFYKEKEIFEPGDRGFPVFEINGVKYGMLVCFDWIFPEAMRTLSLKGAEVILHPTNLVLPYYQEAAVTRAVENKVYIVLSNRTGVEERGGQSNSFTGQSEIVSPQGEVILKVGEEEEGIFCADIEPEKAKDKNITEFNNIFEDRRPETYEI